MKIWHCKCRMFLGVDNIFNHHYILTNDGTVMCDECYQERKTMPNIKITAEIDGKQVPLETVSTETFEAIKALEKPKEIPVARLATNRGGVPRLLFRPVNNIRLNVGCIYALDLKLGICSNQWTSIVDKSETAAYYENIKPL